MNISKQLKRKLQRDWLTLVREKNYLIPETREDFQDLGIIPYFKIGYVMVFAKDTVKTTVREAAERLKAELGPDRFSLDTVAHAIRDEIRTHFSENRSQPFDWHLNRILKAIRSHDHMREHIRQVSGLILKDFDLFSHGTWTIQRVSEDTVKTFSDRDKGPVKWRESIARFIHKHFVRQTVISVRCRGDEEESRIKADQIARHVLNVLRLFICIHAAEKNAQHMFEIQIDNSAEQSTASLAFDSELSHYSTRQGIDVFRWRQSYELTQQNLQIMRESWDADILWSLIESPHRNDLQDSLVTAVTWFGDAQQDYDPHVAYVKYWTALEALATGHEEGRLESRLKTVIPILISQVSTDAPSKSRVSKSYDLRSQIIHRGSRTRVTRRELDTLCNWTSQCILTTVKLIKRGYQNRSQVEGQSKKIEKSRLQTETRPTSRKGRQ